LAAIVEYPVYHHSLFFLKPHKELEVNRKQKCSRSLSLLISDIFKELAIDENIGNGCIRTRSPILKFIKGENKPHDFGGTFS
jgi:hypothetical protein